MSRLRVLLALVVILTAAHCSNDTTTPVVKTKDVSGTLPPQSSVWYTITTSQAGALAVSLTNFSGATPVRLAIGDAGLACKALASNAAATAGTVITASVGASNYCVTIADPAGQLTAPASYTLHLTYP